jgi:predicted metalloprotease with PDZ domain
MDHIFVLYDRATHSVWYPDDDAVLQAVGGGLKGSSIPFLDEPAPVTLGEWLDAHADSTILLPSEMDVRRMNRPYLGVGLEEQDGSVVITEVAEGTPAAEAGFQPGDILRSFNGTAVADRGELRDILLDLAPGDTVDVVVERNGRETTVRPTLAKR